MTTHDDLESALQHGQTAALVKHETSRRLAEQERALLESALTKFRVGLLTSEQARDTIAQLSALRDLTFALDKDVRKASDARERVMSPGPAGTATRSR